MNGSYYNPGDEYMVCRYNFQLHSHLTSNGNRRSLQVLLKIADHRVRNLVLLSHMQERIKYNRSLT